MNFQLNGFEVPETKIPPVVNFFTHYLDLTVTGTPEWTEALKHAKWYHDSDGNDMMAKKILRHDYGERMAIVFRDWVRSFMDPNEELEDGGSSFETYEECVEFMQQKEQQNAA